MRAGGRKEADAASPTLGVGDGRWWDPGDQVQTSSSSCSKCSQQLECWERALQELGGVKASRACQGTVTAAKGQAEEIPLQPGFPHISRRQRKQERDQSPSGEPCRAGPTKPRPHKCCPRCRLWWMGTAPVHVCPQMPHSSAVPLPASHSQRGLEHLGRSKGLRYSPSVSTEEPGAMQEGHKMPR